MLAGQQGEKPPTAEQRAGLLSITSSDPRKIAMRFILQNIRVRLEIC
jgi:hypothetical protein